MANTSLIEKVSVITNAVRTLLAAVVVGGLGFGGWYGYTTYNATEIEAKKAAEALAQAEADLAAKDEVIRVKQEEIGALTDEVAQQQQEIERLDTAMRLLKVDHRVARVSVVEQAKDEASDTTITHVDFQEINGNGDPIGDPKRIEIKGDIVYIDSWVVKFDDKYVEQADIDRSTSLVLFRRIFGERQEPRDGFALDEDGERPTVYGRGGKMSDFEKKIWDDFWEVANSKSKQDDLGIRAIHGEALSIKAVKGKIYYIEVRASGGPSLKNPGEVVAPKPPAA